MNPTIDHSTCPNCGGLIPAEASQGVCPKCLLASVALPTEAGASSEHRPEPPSVQEIQAALPQLQILDLIGCGGMGAVYRARQPKLDRLVALKVLLAPLAADAAFAARFNREACLLARLNHPGVVSVFDYGEAGGFFYLVMEYVDGVNLRQAMQAGRFTPVQTLALVPKICEALQYAHDEGILHRDIKPENILLDLRGRVKIADFGIAKLAGENARGPGLTASGAAVGTPHYMAPEQLEHPQDVDLRADLYSLGVVFYEMLAGELPIGRFAPPSHKSGVDPRIDEVVLRALEKERERRQHNATEIKQQVETISSTARPAAQPAGPAPLATPRTSMCYISTPEYLRTFRGRFLYIYQGKGELRLDRDTLSFHSGWQIVTIPLPAIARLAQGAYPASAKPAPLHYLSVTFDERGVARTLFFTPAQSALVPVWMTNKVVAEWIEAVQQAVCAATGREMPVDRSNASPAWGVAEIAKTYVLTAAGCTAAYAVIPILLHHRLPNRLSEIVWGPVTAAWALGILLAVRWWRQRFAPPGVQPPQEPQFPTATPPQPTMGAPTGTRIVPDQTPPPHSTCYLSTPERMRRCFPAPAARIFTCKGQARLHPDRLVLSSPWRTELWIPLAAIQDLKVGQFQMWTTPWVMKYASVNFVSVTFDDAGHSRTALFTPVTDDGGPDAPRRTLETEWFDALSHAIAGLAGRAPQLSTPTAPVYSAEPDWGRKGWPLFFAGLAGAIAVWLIPEEGPLAGARWPLAVLSALLWAATLAFSLGFLHANAALKRLDFDAVTAGEPPLDPPPASVGAPPKP